MQANDIKSLIEAGLPGAEAHVTGDDGVHFDATVIYAGFAAKSRIEKQQMVYTTLGDRIANGTIHAISIKTFTPEEFNKR